jgi:hypothetical protein
LQNSKYKLELHFQSKPSLHLSQTRFFIRGQEKPLTCYRGSAFNVPKSFSAFRWSAAVQALSVLFLKHAAKNVLEEDSENSEFLLSGESGTLASSLDYAISKQPAWMQDMFGVRSEGELVLRDFVIRANPERKRPGPVMIWVDSSKLSSKDISIYLDDTMLANSTSLASLCSQIQALNLQKKRQRNLSKAIEKDPSSTLSRLTAIYASEIRTALSTSVVFDRLQFNKRMREFAKDTEFNKRGGGKVPLDQLLDRNLFGNAGLGVFNHEIALLDKLKGEQPIRIVAPKREAATTLLLIYLKYTKGYNIEVVDDYPHSLSISTDMADDAFLEQYDGALLSLSAAATYCSLSKNSRFQPMMLMPSISYTLVASQSSVSSGNKTQTSNLYYIQGSASHTEYLKEVLTNSGVSNREKTKWVNAHATESMESVFSKLKSSDETAKALLWFPYNKTLALPQSKSSFNSSHKFNDQLTRSSTKKIREGLQDWRSELILFGGKRFTSDPELAQALAIAIRGAWTHLLQDSKLVESLLRRMFKRRSYERIYSWSLYSDNQVTEDIHYRQ